jgi:hypothetical protein
VVFVGCPTWMAMNDMRHDDSPPGKINTPLSVSTAPHPL